MVESCYECESLRITYRFLRDEDSVSYYAAQCRDCGTEWETDEYEG